MSRHRERFLTGQRLKDLVTGLAVSTATAVLILGAGWGIALVSGLPFHKALTVALFAAWAVLVITDLVERKNIPDQPEPEEASA